MKFWLYLRINSCTFVTKFAGYSARTYRGFRKIYMIIITIIYVELVCVYSAVLLFILKCSPHVTDVPAVRENDRFRLEKNWTAYNIKINSNMYKMINIRYDDDQKNLICNLYYYCSTLDLRHKQGNKHFFLSIFGEHVLKWFIKDNNNR